MQHTGVAAAGGLGRVVIGVIQLGSGGGAPGSRASGKESPPTGLRAVVADHAVGCLLCAVVVQPIGAVEYRLGGWRRGECIATRRCRSVCRRGGGWFGVGRLGGEKICQEKKQTGPVMVSAMTIVRAVAAAMTVLSENLRPS